MDFRAKITGAFELLDTSIRDGSINTQILASRMDRVTRLMEEVALKERDAEEAKEEAAVSSLDILTKVEALKQTQQRLKEKNDVYAREMNEQKEVLLKEVKELQIRMSGVLNGERRSLGFSDEVHRVLKKRLTKAYREKNLADKEKVEKEKLALETLAFEESQMLKLVEESKRLKQEAAKYSKLRDLFKERESIVNILHGDMSDTHQDINLIIERLDQPVLKLHGFLSSTKKSAELVLEKQEGSVVGHSVSTEGSVASAQIYANGAQAPLTVKHNVKKGNRSKKKWRPAERRGDL